MTEQDKQLLLKDLCARLPYGVRMQDYKYTELAIPLFDFGTVGKEHPIQMIWRIICEGWLPYLRPMSSMTEDEKSTYSMFFNEEGLLNTSVGTYIDWLLENHFDYNGLIKMGLALEAPEGMYNNCDNEY